MNGALERVTQLDRSAIEDVILGCAMPEAEQGLNIARTASFRAGLPVTCSAMTINRFCSSGLQSIAMAVERIRGGGARAGWPQVILAGGVESMSYVPMGGNKPSLNPWLVENYPGSYLSMGLTAERVAKHYGITREQMDQFAYESHQKALAAIAAGRFEDEIVPVPVTNTVMDTKGKVKAAESIFKVDEGPRADTSLEALAKLKPVFHANGTVTAGNSSQMSDGAAAAVAMSAELAAQLGVPGLGRLIAFATAGCDPEEMGIGPVLAVPKALTMAGLTLDQIGLIELNEAFAAQTLAVIKLLGIDPAKVNVNGGAIALGHPLGCTGAKLTATLLREMPRRNVQYGMVTMCVGGGMGAAGIFESFGK
jgi:acetyl-CoA acyltransferase